MPSLASNLSTTTWSSWSLTGSWSSGNWMQGTMPSSLGPNSTKISVGPTVMTLPVRCSRPACTTRGPLMWAGPLGPEEAAGLGSCRGAASIWRIAASISAFISAVRSGLAGAVEGLKTPIARPGCRGGGSCWDRGVAAEGWPHVEIFPAGACTSVAAGGGECTRDSPLATLGRMKRC